MAQNFLSCDRDQALLMPPSLREWLGQDELAWCVLDVVAEMDLAAIYGDYRVDGHGRAAFDPGMMVALLLYAYAIGERSSRAIERRCRVDVAFRVITANQVPDHATIARFRARHEQALAELFGQVLALCARAGLVSLGVVALDSTKVAANASSIANRTYEQIAAELLAEAEAADEAEDQRLGDARGDELPPELADPTSRRARLQQAKRQIENDHQAAKDAHRERMQRRAELEAEGRRVPGRTPKGPPEEVPADTRLNVTDRDSRSVRSRQGFIQGYNAQAAATSEQIIIAAEIIGNGVDYGLLEPVTDAALAELAAAGVEGHIEVLLADAGYWDSAQIENLAARGIQPLVPPDAQNSKRSIGKNRKGPRYDFMRRVIATNRGRGLYSQRKHVIEPIFGQIKHNRHISRFQRRGITACRSEWRLIAASHNILKLWRANSPPAAA